jgi:hypothetical protein
MGYDAHVCVIGIRPPDDEWKKMKAAWDACEAAGIGKPDKLWEFFGDDGPHEEGLKVKLPIQKVATDDETISIGVRNGHEQCYYLVAVDDIPEKISHIKVWLSNSW